MSECKPGAGRAGRTLLLDRVRTSMESGSSERHGVGPAVGAALCAPQIDVVKDYFTSLARPTGIH